MKQEKGFTLIELLAVIVILSVLIVVAIPKTLNVIEKSRESTAKSSIKIVKDAIRMQISSVDIVGTDFISDESGCYTFDFDNQISGNAEELKLKNKEKISGSIKYCNGNFLEDTLAFNDVKSVSKVDDKKINLLNELLNDNYTTDNMSVTKYDNYVSLYSSYGSDGIVILKKQYNPKKYTKMIIKGKRIDGDSSFYHLFPGYTTDLSSWGAGLNTFYPESDESFNYTIDLNLSDSIVNIYPRIQFCVGTIEIYEWYLE